MVRGASKGLVVLISGWAGERALVRLLSAGGRVRVGGQPLAEPVRQPASHLRRTLVHHAEGGKAPVVLVQPHHLWLRNQLDADAFVAELVADGITIVSLNRIAHLDRGLSRSLCGARAEVLPTGRQAVDPGEVAVFAKEDEMAGDWFATVVPDPAMRLAFEADLATGEARQATLDRVTACLGVPAGAAPPEHDLPVSEALWDRVAQPEALRTHLEALGWDERG